MPVPTQPSPTGDPTPPVNPPPEPCEQEEQPLDGPQPDDL